MNTEAQTREMQRTESWGRDGQSTANWDFWLVGLFRKQLKLSLAVRFVLSPVSVVKGNTRLNRGSTRSFLILVTFFSRFWQLYLS